MKESISISKSDIQLNDLIEVYKWNFINDYVIFLVTFIEVSPYLIIKGIVLGDPGFAIFCEYDEIDISDCDLSFSFKKVIDENLTKKLELRYKHYLLQKS